MLWMVLFSLLAAGKTDQKKLTAKLNFYQAQSPDASKRPLIVLIPGGPGFSGASWGPVDTLLRSFDVATVDLPGTGGLPRAKAYTYESIASAIEEQLDTLKRPLVISGMSFGVVFAAELATRGKYQVEGYVGFSAPISPEGLRALGSIPNPHYTPEMAKSEDTFNAKPDDQTWEKMLEAVAPIYFTEPFREKGKNLLRSDKSEYKIYLDVFFPYVQDKVKTDVLQRIKKFPKTKLLVAGEADHLVPAKGVEQEAHRLGCKFEMIPKASHFILFEQPEQAARLFEKYFLHR